MEYVYMKQEMPTTATGVPVTVSVVDPNGNYYTVGTTTSDTSGAFKLAFDPQVPGEYTILASFAGSGSYYKSSAETAVYVGEPHVTVAPTAAPVQSMADQYFVPAVVGIIVAIVVCFAVTIVLLRKRP
jgi:hypothetical protein